MKMTSLCLAVAFSLVWPPATRVEAQTKKDVKKPAVVAVFSLDGPITEKPRQDDLQMLFGTEMGESLKDLIARIKKAGDDPDVKGVALVIDSPYVGMGQIEELRAAMDEIKGKGKKIYVHADLLTMSQYVLLSGASQISMVPTGYMFITGMYGEQLYVRGLLDKIGVKPDFFTRGAYKSAAELFMRTGPSPEAQRMYDWLFDGLYDNQIGLIAKGRGVPPAKVREWIDHGIYSAESAKKLGIIDAIQHRQDFEADLRKLCGDDVQFDKKYGRKKKSAIDFSSPFGILQFYAKLLSPPRREKSDKDAVAVVYLEGIILPGSPDPSPFGSEGVAYSTPIRKALDKVAGDDSIKAVVFRIDSGGGSAVASEIILDATKRVAAKKPFIVSMGNVAGSGGYYVACGAKTIFADPSTITGSIGVVGGKFATTEMWGKIGINWTPIKRGANSGMLSSYDVFSKSERAAFEQYMDEVYNAFKGHVVAIRGKRLKKKIDDLAGGRVFTGQQALEFGLIDKLGGLDDAIQYAAGQAKLEDYEIRVVPRPKNFMEELMGGLTDKESDNNHLQTSLKTPTANPSSLWKAALPYLHDLEPGRLRAVKQALDQLSAAQHERVLLTMPVLTFPD